MQPFDKKQKNAIRDALNNSEYVDHPECSKCHRCRLWNPESGYDKRKGYQHLLCNRCAEVVKKDWPDFELTKAFFDERKNKYLAE